MEKRKNCEMEEGWSHMETKTTEGQRAGPGLGTGMEHIRISQGNKTLRTEIIVKEKTK